MIFALWLALRWQTGKHQSWQNVPPPHPLPNCFHVADTHFAGFAFSVLAVAISAVLVWSLGGRKRTSAKGLHTCNYLLLLARWQQVALLVHSGLGDPVTLWPLAELTDYCCICTLLQTGRQPPLSHHIVTCSPWSLFKLSGHKKIVSRGSRVTQLS